MKLHDAIEHHHQTGHWFRPITWDGTGYAHTVSEGYVTQVPGKSGTAPGITSDAESLAGDWQIVEPATVLAERESIWKQSNA